MQIVGEAGWQPCTCARQWVSPSRCQRERFGSFPVSIIVWFNCWLYAKRKYLLIILQKERSPAGRGAGVRRPGISRHAQQTCQPTCHTPIPAAATVIVTERDPEFTSSLTDLQRGAQAPYILYACAILLSGWLSDLFSASAPEITQETCTGDLTWVWAWRVSVSSVMAPQPHGRAGDTLRSSIKDGHCPFPDAVAE